MKIGIFPASIRQIHVNLHAKLQKNIRKLSFLGKK